MSPTPRFQPMDKNKPVLVVGAGVFGLSTALELKNRGYRDVTVLDRHSPPVPDGSSVDVSRIIRPDYADPLYSRMAVECMAKWETDYSQFFHRPGFVLISTGKNGHPYIEQCKKVLADQGVRYSEIPNKREFEERYPAIASSNLGELTGYVNHTSGWADAAGAVRAFAERVSDAGVSFIIGDRGTVTGFVKSGKKVTGVKVRSGGDIPAERVILATGAWTSRLVDMENSAHSTAQPVGLIQLTPEEAKSIAHIPVCINLTTGFFLFPPTPDTNVLKIARHGYGYESDVQIQRSQDNGRASVISSPNIRTAGTVKPGFFIPEDAEQELRRGLAVFLPQFKDHPWFNQRLCWYTDTATGDFIVDHHPDLEGVFVATGGSGHGFKFLPILGRYTADCFEGKAPQEFRRRWAWRPSSTRGKGDGSRGGPDGRKLTPAEQSRL